MATEDEILNRKRRVPAVPPQVSPLAADINAQIRRPGGISPVANQINMGVTDARRAVQAPVAAPASPLASPAYRTAAPLGQPQFQQTPTPVNPGYRPAAPVQAQPVPAARSTVQVAEGAAAARGGRLVPALAGGLEALNVVQAGRQGGMRAAADEAVASGGRLAAAKAGAELARAIPLPSALRAAAPLVGGVAGYAAGQQGVDALRQIAPDGALQAASIGNTLADNANVPSVLQAASNPATVRTGAALLGGLVRQASADISNGQALRPAVQVIDAGDPASASIAPPTITPAPRYPARAAAAAGGIATPANSTQAASDSQVIMVDPDNARTQPPSTRVVGNWNGRDITETEANTLARRLNGGTGNGLVNGNPTGVSALAAPAPALVPSQQRRGGGGGAQGALIEAPGTGTVEQIDRQLRNLGPANMRSKRDLVGQLLGLRSRIEEGGATRNQTAAISANELAQRADASELSAQVERERTAASAQSSRRGQQQTVTDASGAVYTLGDGGIASPVRLGDGTALTTATKRDTTTQQIAAKILENTLPIGATPEQINSAVQAANTAAAGIASGDTGPASAPASKADFIKQAKAANPKATDAQLGAYYDQNYGRGN